MNASAPVAMVTGVTGGMVTEIIKNLANCGYALAFASSGDVDKARALERFCAVQGAETLLLAGDINVAGTCGQWVADTMTFFRRLDVLIMNVGYNSELDWTETKENTAFVRQIQAETDGLTELARNAARPMTSLERGRIVIVSLPCGALREERQRLLSTAIRGMTVDLAGELCKTGVTVNAVLPGWLDFPGDKDPGNAWPKTIPMTRPGQLSEVSGVVRFLLSDASSYITGHTIPVSGGLDL